MIRALLLGYLLLLTLITGYLLWQNQRQRIAYVDSGKLLNGYQAMIEARKVYGTKAKKWQANVDTLSADVQRAIRDFEHKSPAMTARERTLASELLRSKQRSLVDYQRAIQETAQQEDAKSTQQVVAQVNAFLERYGKVHNHDVILVASPSGTIAYAKPGLDLTEEVTAALNKEYTKSGR